MARSSECKEQYAQKVLDTADIVREAWFQLSASIWADFSIYLDRRTDIS